MLRNGTLFHSRNVNLFTVLIFPGDLVGSFDLRLSRFNFRLTRISVDCLVLGGLVFFGCLAAAFDLLNADCTFYSANEDDTVAYYAYTISRTGSYLSECGGIPEGTPIAYLIAPRVEAQYAIDAALKAADVRMCAYFEPPSETNFSGAYLTGTQSACKAACDAFADAVVFCVENALKY